MYSEYVKGTKPNKSNEDRASKHKSEGDALIEGIPHRIVNKITKDITKENK